MFKLLWLLLAALWETTGGSDDDSDPDSDDSQAGDDGDGSDDDSGSDSDDDDDSGAGGGDNDLDADALRAELRKVRNEAASRRRQLREREQSVEQLQEQNRRILEALGITDNSDDDDPSAEAERLRSENRRLRTQNRFAVVARSAGADEDLTWGYLLARGEIDSLDPDGDDFETTLQERIAAALEAKPSLAVTTNPPPPPRGGGDLDGDNPPPDDPSQMPMDQYMDWRKKQKE